MATGGRRRESITLRGIMNYAHLSVSEHRELFSKAGSSDVQVFEEYDKGWFCAVGKKRE